MKPGIYPDLPNEEYHRCDGVSNSMLSDLARSPAHFQAARRKPREETDAMAIGTAIHCAILEPERFATDYTTTPKFDRRTTAGKAQAAAFEASGKIGLSAADMQNVKGMAASMHADDYISRLIRHPKRQTELSVFAQDPETGLLVRCRFDLIIPEYGVAADVKKTQDVRPWAWDATVHKYGYHRQVAFYMDVWKWATGEELSVMPLLAVEEQDPYACRAKILADNALEKGRADYRRLLNAYADCAHRGVWPGYEYWADDDEGYDVCHLPAYAYRN